MSSQRALEVPDVEKDDLSKDIDYKIEDVPPWYVSMVLSFQHYMTMLGGTVTYPYLIAGHLCIPSDDPARGALVSTTFFVSGICTFLQTTFGVRLPIVQGSSMAFLAPALAILHLPEFECPIVNGTIYSDSEIWMIRMREVQGAIIGSSLCEVVIGFTGLIGFLLTWITPLAIIPTITLVGLSLFAEAAQFASLHWGISALTVILMIVFSQCLRNVNVPFPKYSTKTGWKMDKHPAFKLFPILLTLACSWSICAILTVCGALAEDSPARTDSVSQLLDQSPWFNVPYPGQFGLPTFSLAAIVGMLAGVLASCIESVGDYYACARLCGAPPPPKHAINRGIFMEGIGCVIAGLFGTASGVTSFSENIGAIGITKVASRRVIQIGSLLMLLFGTLGKFGGVFMTIPKPIVGGIFCIMFSMITAVGLSSLHFVDLNSSRNLFVLGFSLFMGLCLPKWVQANPGSIKTGSQLLDQTILILLSTNMLVGGILGFLLDNIIPGTDKERGILKWRKETVSEENSSKTYELPLFPSVVKSANCFRHLPISPTYKESSVKDLLVLFRRNKSNQGNTQQF